MVHSSTLLEPDYDVNADQLPAFSDSQIFGTFRSDRIEEIEYEERLGAQPKRGSTTVGGLVLFVLIVGSGPAFLFSQHLLKNYFLNHAMEESKKTFVVEPNDAMMKDVVQMSQSVTVQEYNARAEARFKATTRRPSLNR